MNTIKNPIYVFVLVFTFLSACTSGPSSGPSVTKSSEEPVAQINNEAISKKQLEDRLAIEAEGPGANKAEGITDEKKANVLDNLITEEIVLQEARKEGVFQNSERLRREVMREYFQVKLGGGKEEPAEDEIKNLYESEKSTLDSIHVRHILIKSKDSASDTAALSKAKEILLKLKAQGDKANFASTAQQVSEDATTKDKGGDLGFFTYDKMVPAFSKAAFALKNVKDISDVIKTEFGYHIIQLVEDRRGLENNRSSLRMVLAKDKKKQLYDNLLAELRKKASVKIHQNVVATATPSELIPASR